MIKMRLSDVLSKDIVGEYKQVENFMGTKKCPCGKSKRLDVGRIAWNFYCKNCDDFRTFISDSDTFAIPIDDTRISIDCRLFCATCGISVPAWFLVDSDNPYITTPKVRMVNYEMKLPSVVSVYKPNEDIYSFLISKADLANRQGLGAGSVVYLRKIMEMVFEKIGRDNHLDIYKDADSGRLKPFKQVCQIVDDAYKIVPEEFSSNAYDLFSIMSEIVHGRADEEEAIRKYESIKRLVESIVENVKNKDEINNALLILGISVA